MTETRPWPKDPRYLVSDDGTVRGPSGWVIAVVPSKQGYRIVSFYRPDGTRGSVGVHVMVCETFIGPRPPGAEACHDNGDPADCRLENLRWDTKRGNQADQIRHGTNGRRLTVKQVAAIRAEPNTSRAELAARYGVTPGTISHIRTGHSWSGLRDPKPAPHQHDHGQVCRRCATKDLGEAG